MIRSKLSSLREYLTPVYSESNFRTTGEISPEEFVRAGDYLVYKFPTWSWGTCPKNLQKKFLPADKQFLITKHVPLYQRVATFVPDAEPDEQIDDDSEWVPRVHTQHPKEHAQDLEDLVEENVEDSVALDDDGFTQIDAELNLRNYDLYITYSTLYRVPKVYLVGFNLNGIPLVPKQMYEDISGDYKDKTATIEPLPVQHNTTLVLIHPCKHLSVMRVFMKHAKAHRSDLGSLSLEEEGVRVDHYLVIFLKFIASVTPGIEYDFTMEAL